MRFAAALQQKKRIVMRCVHSKFTTQTECTRANELFAEGLCSNCLQLRPAARHAGSRQNLHSTDKRGAKDSLPLVNVIAN